MEWFFHLTVRSFSVSLAVLDAEWKQCFCHPWVTKFALMQVWQKLSIKWLPKCTTTSSFQVFESTAWHKVQSDSTARKMIGRHPSMLSQVDQNFVLQKCHKEALLSPPTARIRYEKENLIQRRICNPRDFLLVFDRSLKDCWRLQLVASILLSVGRDKGGWISEDPGDPHNLLSRLSQTKERFECWCFFWCQH